MSVKRMLKEEWRMHSRIYSGRSFAFFPFLVFFLTAGFSFIVERYATVSANVIVESLPFFGAFLGLGVGAVGFSSKDAFRNVLGRTNFLLYSSRTLPLSEKKLLSDFIIKDLLYYTAFFISPVVLGVWTVSGPGIGALMILPGFIGGLVAALIFSRSSMRVPSLVKPSYDKGNPLRNKSLLDIQRSSGGMLKIVFSLSVLTGFYWFMVLKFSFARVFLQNTLVSFAVLLGTISITIYNWLNRFDSPEDYLHLPVSRSDILRSKQRAFVMLAFPFITIFTILPTIFYSGNVYLALVTAYSTSTFALGVVSRIFMLDPNTRIYSSKHFSKVILLNSVVVVPLLIATVFGLPEILLMLVNGLAAGSGLGLIYIARKKV